MILSIVPQNPWHKCAAASVNTFHASVTETPENASFMQPNLDSHSAAAICMHPFSVAIGGGILKILIVTWMQMN